jgi:putative membrane protein
MMWWDGNAGAGGGFMLVWLLVGLSLTALAIVAIVWLVRSTSAAGGRDVIAHGSRSPREELDGRYARGEITRDEYQRIRQDLDEPGRARA